MDRRVLVVTTALGVALACAADAARAQSQGVRDPSVPSLFEPHFDGEDGRPQRFRKPGAVTRPSSGAGTTGFDATHTRAKRKAREMERKRARERAENLPPVVASGPDRTVAPVFQRQESAAALHRRAANTAPVPLDATGTVTPRPVRRRFVEDDPFGPVGTYYGSFLYKPALEVSTGYNSNPGHRLNGAGSSFQKVAPELLLKSDWSRHEVSADLRGSYIWYNDQPNLDRPDVLLRGKARIDITRQTKADLEGRFAYAADNPGDPNLPNDVKKPPLYTVSGGTAGIRHSFNRLELSLKGSVDSTRYQDGTLNNGQPVNFADRNYDQYGTRLRASYEWLPGIIPFAEYGMDERKHDQAFDVNGVNRDSTGQSFRVGTSFLLTGYLTGEIAVGWLERNYADPALLPIHGTLVDASLTYYATPLTTLKLDMATTVNESIIGGVSGSFSHYYAAQIEHAFRRWLVGSVRFGFTETDYVGSPRTDKLYAFSTALTYKLTRDWWLKGEYRREWQDSTDNSADYTANIFLIGLRLQR